MNDDQLDLFKPAESPLGPVPPPYSGTMTIDAARAILEPAMQAKGGTTCPCCTRHAEVYDRQMTSVTARFMIGLWREGGGEGFSHSEEIGRKYCKESNSQGGYRTLGQYWGLIAESPVKREDGGRRGWWRLTPLGVRFLFGEVSVPQKAPIYNKRDLGFKGKQVTIDDVLGQGFDLRELRDGT